MRVGEQEADSTIANALSMSLMFSLGKDDAVREVRTVARVVDRWKKHFKGCGVTSGDIDLHAEQIDRPFLRDQRNEFLQSLPPIDRYSQGSCRSVSGMWKDKIRAATLEYEH